MTVRRVSPERLDALSADDPAAIRSRRDLRIFNRLMGTAPFMERMLRGRAGPGARVLEIGAGTGELAARLRPLVGRLDGLDMAGRPPSWPPGANWFQARAERFTGWQDYPVVIGSLVLHHLRDGDLGVVGERMRAHARLIVAMETRRSRLAQAAFVWLCRLIRADPVSRHDGRVSLEAGFRGDELPRLLGLDPGVWAWTIGEGLFGSYRMVAERRT